jgi:hypothetical protein
MSGDRLSDYLGVTPREVQRSTWRWAPAALTITVAIIGVCLVGTFICWQAGWWFFAQSVNRQNQVYQNSYGTQQADIQAMETAEQAIPGAVDRAQVLADVNAACAAGAKVTNLGPGDAAWYAANCDGGVISQSSQYNTGS